MAAREAELAAARSDVATERAEREAMNGDLNTLLARALRSLDTERAKLNVERERAAAAVVAHLALAERVAAERVRPLWRRWAA